MKSLLKNILVCSLAYGLPRLFALLVVERWRETVLLILMFWGGMAYMAYLDHVREKS
ncbi:MAG: hypothetical protein ACYDHW_10865 [Syntrophorhabdaceae bacterium]